MSVDNDGGPAGLLRDDWQRDRNQRATLNAEARGLIDELRSLATRLADDHNVHFTVLDDRRTGSLSRDEEAVLERLLGRRGSTDWSQMRLGNGALDREARAAANQYLSATQTAPHRKSLKKLQRLNETHRRYCCVVFGEDPGDRFLAAPADALELVGQADSTRAMSRGLVRKALENVGDGRNFNFNALVTEVNRLARESGVLLRLVERWLGFELPEGGDTEKYLDLFWKLEFLLHGWQATPAGLVLRPRALANWWNEMTSLPAIVHYYGEAAIAGAAMAVFRPTSSARIAERAGYRSLLEELSSSDDSSSSDDDS